MKKTKKLMGMLVAAACVLGLAAKAHADMITITLGETPEDIVETGIGDNGSGYAQWFITMGACSPSGANSSCVLSGDYSSSSTYGSGTYSFVTTYAGTGTTFSTPYGNGPTPLVGISQFQGSGKFYFDYLAPGTTMALNLDQSGGSNYTIPIYGPAGFLDSFGFPAAGPAVCTGVPICSDFDVGETPGATFATPVTGHVDISTVPLPSSLSLFGFGLAGLLLTSRLIPGRRRRPPPTPDRRWIRTPA